MSLPVFQAIAANILGEGYRGTVNFSGMGESLLNPLLPRFIEMISDKVSTCLTTNGAALTPRMAGRLIDAGLKTIIVSFNGANATMFGRMSGGLDFERVKRHVGGLAERARGGGFALYANVSVTDENGGEIREIRELLNSLGVEKVIFAQAHARGGALDEGGICDTPKPPFKTGRCDIFAYTVFVSSEGDVLSCCHDLAGGTALGNLTKTPVRDILEKKLAVMAGGGPGYDICAECNDIYRYMFARTPDGRPLSEWVFDLRAKSAGALKMVAGELWRAQKRAARKGEAPDELGRWLAAIIEKRAL